MAEMANDEYLDEIEDTKVCHECMEEVHVAARRCPHCRARFYTPLESATRWVLVLIAGLVVAGVLYVVASNYFAAEGKKKADKVIECIMADRPNC
jgi:uncharacterized paraquat-inducible protein A